MSRFIKSINLREEGTIHFRDVTFDNTRIVQSININQMNGSFVTTEPLENDGQIVLYPQSPNNPLYNINVYKNFTGYGDLSMPTDARFDGIRRKMWVADTGNSKVIKIGINDYSIETTLEDQILPHSVVPESNLGGVFVKGFSGINTGIVSYYKSNGELEDYFTFPCSLGRTSTNVEISREFVQGLPLPLSMAYDHVRWRLWWTAEDYIYMIDIRNRQVIQQKLSPKYTDTRGIDIDCRNGNAFAIAKNSYGYWHMIQVFRDNNMILDDAYLELGSLG